MKKTLNAFAAAVLLGSTAIAPFAYAQDATAPAAGTEAPAVAPMTDAAPAAANSTMAATTDTYLTEQSASQISANNFIGQSVYTGDDSIGEINDLIIEEKGDVVAAVIGVGGFLGIGEKDVAVPMSKITVTRDADDANELRLTTMETAETLKSAPEFKKLDARADASSTMTPTDNTTTSSTVTK